MSAFSDEFGGEALVDGDAGYDEARSVWNGDIDRRPALIARCHSAAQVAAAVAHGRDEGLDIAVRGGGHSYAGHAVCEGGLMIDLSPLNQVTVDAGARRARCGGGATWADLDGATQEHGLAVTGGVISHTGVGGLTLGGGMGWLTKEAGLSCDNLVSATVVTAAGEVITASPDDHADLHWALRGGGGNFGVVTELEFALHEIGPLVNVGVFFWPVEELDGALRVARDVAAGLPGGTGIVMNGANAPPAPFVPEEHHFRPGFVLAIAGFGSPEAHAEAIAPARAGVAPLFEFVTPIPYVDLQKMLDDSAPWGAFAYEKALYLDDLSDGVIEVIADRLPRKSSPMSVMPVFPLGGRYHEIGDDDTAFGGSRASKYVIAIEAIAPTPDLLAIDRPWVREFWDALQPHAAGVGGYVNFLNDPDEERLRASYGAKYERLVSIKGTYDPDNLFHLNANIKPLAAV